MTLPPLISGGLPVLGHAVEMLRDRQSLFKRGHAEHGDVFAVKLGPQYAVIVTGAELNRLVYTETDKALNMQEGYAFLKKAFGEILFTASTEAYYNQRPILQEIFRRERMGDYIRAMQVEIQHWLDGLGDSGKIDMTQEMLSLTQAVAAHAFIGPNYRETLDDHFWKLYGHISESIDPVFNPNLPLPKFFRRDRARDQIKRILGDLITERRQHPDQHNDLMQGLLSTKLKNGDLMDDEQVSTLFMGLIFAGHETTAGQAAWMVALLLQNPDALALVKRTIAENVAYGATFDGALLSQLDPIYWAVDETTRMRPSADVQMRTTSEETKIGNYTVPAGWRVMVNAANSHNLPDVFENPDRFDPTRYAPERGEGKNPFAIIGFGGGIHKCTGMNFAKNEMAIITALLFQQFDLTLLSEDIHVVMGHGATRPSPVWVSYKRKPITDLTDAATIHEAVAAGCPHITARVGQN